MKLEEAWGPPQASLFFCGVSAKKNLPGGIACDSSGKTIACPSETRGLGANSRSFTLVEKQGLFSGDGTVEIRFRRNGFPEWLEFVFLQKCRLFLRKNAILTRMSSELIEDGISRDLSVPLWHLSMV